MPAIHHRRSIPLAARIRLHGVWEFEGLIRHAPLPHRLGRLFFPLRSVLILGHSPGHHLMEYVAAGFLEYVRVPDD